MTRTHSLRALVETSLWALLALATAYFCLLPGLTVARDLSDPALAGPGIPRRAVTLHRDLTPRLERWARERVASGRASHVAQHDVPTTEWPPFTAVFYLMASEGIEAAVRRGELPPEDSPLPGSRSALDASRDLLLDPSHHTWVRAHWGDDYLERENFFFRSLLIAGLTSYEALTKEGSSLPFLREQVESLSAELDASELGLLNDYPGECYPIDVVAGLGFIQRADTLLGTDHSAVLQRALRGFVGERADELGLVPFRVALPGGKQLQPARGIGMSWVLAFSPDLWPEQSREWYGRYEASFWQDRGWAAGFREFAPGQAPEWTVEVDAGPVVDGFGTSANAFAIAAARRNGRFDHAYTLSTQLLAATWPLPDGTLLVPRLVSHATDAPYLGEAGILYFLTVQPAPDVPVVTGGHTPWLVTLVLCAFFGISLLVAVAAWIRLRPSSQGFAAIAQFKLTNRTAQGHRGHESSRAERHPAVSDGSVRFVRDEQDGAEAKARRLTRKP